MKPPTDAALAHLGVFIEAPEIVAGRFRIERRIGTGGMGAVFLATDLLLDRPAAVKILRIDVDPALGERLAIEAKTIAQLEHPGIVPIHDAGRLDDGRSYYVMKFVEGKTLAAATEKSSLNERLRLFLRVSETVAFAHERGFVHRDLKPENVMVGSFGEVFLMDWGIAKRPATTKHDAATGDAPSSASSAGTGHGVVLGTPDFMSPEQSSGGAIDHRTDIFSLGRILARLLDDSALAPKKAIVAIAQKASAGDPSARYRDAQSMAKDVEKFLDGEAVSAYRENVFERSRRLLIRHQFIVGLVVAYLLLRLAVLYFAKY